MTEHMMAQRLLSILALAALAACAEPPPHESGTTNFGQAVRSNMKAQIIATEDEVRALGPAPGERRALTVGRYQTDQVELPVRVDTIGN
jgi:type IV pilus biogenesis protein CpaD/CtpE